MRVGTEGSSWPTVGSVRRELLVDGVRLLQDIFSLEGLSQNEDAAADTEADGDAEEQMPTPRPLTKEQYERYVIQQVHSILQQHDSTTPQSNMSRLSSFNVSQSLLGYTILPRKRSCIRLTLSPKRCLVATVR